MSEPTEREWLEGLHPDAQSAVVSGAIDVLRGHVLRYTHRYSVSTDPTKPFITLAEVDTEDVLAALADLDALVQAVETVDAVLREHLPEWYRDGEWPELPALSAALSRVTGEAR